ncbi:hypothetical protein [Thomasclavelia cocleata]|uniref:hypothetical protein n=1 Tax=Thomasclavelia cocleata TaxID=69824 RepID=UPI002558047A|nr:hypothetical protein [Thomasclavelia cocleata]
MANYIISEKTKKISVSAELSPIEEQILRMYIANGYKVVQKSNKRISVTEKDIENWFKKNNNIQGLEDFKAKKEEKKINKNGKEAKSGYFLAVEWFKNKYEDGYKEIKQQKQRKNK